MKHGTVKKENQKINELEIKIELLRSTLKVYQAVNEFLHCCNQNGKTDYDIDIDIYF